VKLRDFFLSSPKLATSDLPFPHHSQSHGPLFFLFSWAFVIRPTSLFILLGFYYFNSSFLYLIQFSLTHLIINVFSLTRSPLSLSLSLSLSVFYAQLLIYLRNGTRFFFFFFFFFPFPSFLSLARLLSSIKSGLLLTHTKSGLDSLTVFLQKLNRFSH
jgi:hypothetical protein